MAGEQNVGWLEYLKRIPLPEKYNRVCAHMRCTELSASADSILEPNKRCECDGWKLDTDNAGLCSRCKHPQTSHGDVGKMTPEDLDKRTVLALQIEKLMNEKEKADNPQQILLFLQRMNQLKEQIVSGRKTAMMTDALSVDQSRTQPKWDLSTLSDTPPFELPVINDIVRNFIVYKFGSLQESIRHGMERIGSFVISVLNRVNMINALVDRLPRELSSRWRQYCNPPDPAPKLKTTEIFGKYMFRYVYRSLKEIMAKNKHLYTGHEQQLLLFILDLEKELVNDNSPILNRDGTKIEPLANPVLHGMSMTPHMPAIDNNPLASGGGFLSKVAYVQPTASGTINPNALHAHMANSGGAGGGGGLLGASPSSVSAAAASRHAMVSSQQPSAANVGGGGTAGKTVPSPAVNNPPSDPQQLLGPETGSEALSSRDAKAKMEERKGILKFQVVTNDGKQEHLVMLATLKHIFSKQLPNMPRQYIVRLVFDRNHRSLALIKNNVISGGICFRPFKQQGFAEIAFLAIVSSEQVKGYGTHLMNHFKEVCRSDGIYNFLTFADNFAVEYFKKQGFTKEITMAHERWKGFIKDYEGVTLMECCIHPNINYLQVPQMINKERVAVYEKIKELSNSHIVHQGLNFKDGQRHIPIDQIAGIRESGWTSSMSEAEQAGLHKFLEQALADIMNHPSAWPFLKPVDVNEVQDYYVWIKDPIDLQTISERLAGKHYYIAKEIFFADLRRMCQNCRTYNSEGTPYFEAAVEIEKAINKWSTHKIV